VENSGDFTEGRVPGATFKKDLNRADGRRRGAFGEQPVTFSDLTHRTADQRFGNRDDTVHKIPHNSKRLAVRFHVAGQSIRQRVVDGDRHRPAGRQRAGEHR
jgi:hypothetical protein